MKVEMTEREARRTLEGKLVHVGRVSNALWETVKETFGLEFKPEPIVLPERITTREGRLVPLAPISLPWAPELLEAILSEAIARYEKFPDLRKAAGMLAEQILRGGAPVVIMSLARDLQAVLDKGPQS